MKEDGYLFDQSGYIFDGFRSKDSTNKKVLGKFKDETNGYPIREFVGLRSKMYSVDVVEKEETEEEKKKREEKEEEKEENSKKIGKGIKKSALKNKIRHEDYLRCLFGESQEDQRQTVSFYNLRSFDHKIQLFQYNKVGLSCGNDKQYLLDDGITSLSYGHYLLT
jgi:hypothetical protein